MHRNFANGCVLTGNEKKKPKPGHIGQQSVGGKPTGKHLDPALRQVRDWQRGKWFGYKPTAAMLAEDEAAATKPKPKVSQSPAPPEKEFKKSTSKRPAEDHEEATKKPEKKTKVEKGTSAKKLLLDQF